MKIHPHHLLATQLVLPHGLHCWLGGVLQTLKGPQEPTWILAWQPGLRHRRQDISFQDFIISIALQDPTGGRGDEVEILQEDISVQVKLLSWI